MRMARTRISDCTMRLDENDRLYDENDLLYVENELLNNADLYQQRLASCSGVYQFGSWTVGDTARY